MGKKALIKHGRYSHARHMKRPAKQTLKLNIYLGCVVRDIERKALDQDEQVLMLLNRAKRLLAQQRQDNNQL